MKSDGEPDSEFVLFALGGPKGIAAARIVYRSTIMHARTVAREMLLMHPEAENVEIKQGAVLVETVGR